MEAIRFETTIKTDGVVPVEAVRAGERVEVIVLRLSLTSGNDYPLRGTSARYDRPFEPAIPEGDWESH